MKGHVKIQMMLDVGVLESNLPVPVHSARFPPRVVAWHLFFRPSPSSLTTITANSSAPQGRCQLKHGLEFALTVLLCSPLSQCVTGLALSPSAVSSSDRGQREVVSELGQLRYRVAHRSKTSPFLRSYKKNPVESAAMLEQQPDYQWWL